MALWPDSASPRTPHKPLFLKTHPGLTLPGEGVVRSLWQGQRAAMRGTAYPAGYSTRHLALFAQAGLSRGPTPTLGQDLLRGHYEES